MWLDKQDASDDVQKSWKPQFFTVAHLAGAQPLRLEADDYHDLLMRNGNLSTVWRFRHLNFASIGIRFLSF